jgi:hypothetical protein
VLHAFLDAQFEADGEMPQLEAKESSRASRNAIRRKFERFLREFNDLTTRNAGLKPSKRKRMGLVIGLRPYLPSFSTPMQRREQAVYRPKARIDCDRRST